jgi:hypothetical protein
MTIKSLTLSDHTRIELLLSADGNFRGLGAVIVRGVPLRNCAVPLRFQLDTHDGIIYTQLRLREIVPLTNGGQELRLDAIGFPWGRGEIHDDYAQAVLRLTTDDTPVVDDLRIELRPVTQQLGGHEWSGFCYRLHFTSDTRQIHRALVRATWELGGAITGNTVLMPGQCNQPVWHGNRDRHFTTACLKTLDAYGQLHGNSFQLGPRGGMTQAFDFQHGPNGTLLGYWPEFDGLSSLVESQPGEDVLHVVDEYRLPLANELVTPSKWILFTPGNLPEHEARDLWWDVNQAIRNGVMARFGLTPSRMIPEGAYHHNFMNMIQRRIHNGIHQLSLTEGNWFNHYELIDACADQILPRLAELGFRRFKPDPVTESDVTVMGMVRKLDWGAHGDLHCASCCATQRYLPSDFFGGMRAWRRMVDRGHALGMEIGAWISPHFSPRAPIFTEHPEFRMIDALGFPAGGGYGFQTLVTADWNSGIADYVFNDLKRWKEEGGIDYLWVDSVSNLGMVQVNYSECMRINFAAYNHFLARLQGIGITNLTFEAMPVMGCPNFGIVDLQGSQAGQRKDVAGQNDFGWWADEPDMMCEMGLNVDGMVRKPEDAARIQFQGMASRGIVFYAQRMEDGGFITREPGIPDWWKQNIALFNRTEPFMRGTRRLLPNRAGVVWHSEEGRCVWTFADVELALTPGETMETFHGSTAAISNTQARLAGGGVYVIGKRS